MKVVGRSPAASLHLDSYTASTMDLFDPAVAQLLARSLNAPRNAAQRVGRQIKGGQQQPQQPQQSPPGPSQRLSEAVKCGDVATVESIIQTGLKIKHRFDPSGGKLLALACQGGHADVAACLLAHGIQANARSDNSKETYPIHIAANRGDLGLLAVLIDAGADVNVADDEGNTPAHMVAAAANEVCLLWLQRKGADTTARNNMGLTPFQLAASLHGDSVFAGKVLSLRDQLSTAPAEMSAPAPAESPALTVHASSNSAPPAVLADPLPTQSPSAPPTSSLPADAAAAAAAGGGSSSPAGQQRSPQHMARLSRGQHLATEDDDPVEAVATLPPPGQEEGAAPPPPGQSRRRSGSGRPFVGAFPPPLSMPLRRGGSNSSVGSAGGRSLISPRLGTASPQGAAMSPVHTGGSVDGSGTPAAAAAAASDVDSDTCFGDMPIVSAGSIQDRDDDGEEEVIGQGGFATVLRATCDEFPGQVLAYKKWFTPVPSLGDRTEENVISKLESMRAKHMVRHGGDEGPYTGLVRSLAWVRSRRGYQGVLMERAQCSLAEFYARPVFQERPLEECVSFPERMKWGCQLAAAISLLHSCQMLHRDLKPANCLLREGSWDLAVSDFGESRAMSTHTAARTNHTLMLTAPGAKTATHMPPESMEQDGHNGTWGSSSDVWQLGLTLYTVFTGAAPWEGEEVQQRVTGLMSEGKNVNVAWREALQWVFLLPRADFEASVGPWPPCVPEEVRLLVLSCLQTEARGPTPRPKAVQVLTGLRALQQQMAALSAQDLR